MLLDVFSDPCEEVSAWSTHTHFGYYIFNCLDCILKKRLLAFAFKGPVVNLL